MSPNKITVEALQGATKNENPKTACVEFASAIWLESDWPDTCLPGESLLEGRHFKFYQF